ncbi:coiled-coil domain-containing protein 125 [Elysia marginata]|uniref:Coiled-coil domain-containing protein 125 n=1 Tax=Elysia marginata TaxID=1093978 RepID=A0AAV4EYJ7_9GAST|nr:coiled-coil domain-containing protein 125 [Elysia marginata]
MFTKRASPAGSKASLTLHQDLQDHQIQLTHLAIPGLGNGFSSVSDPLLYDYKPLSCQSSVSGCTSEYGAVRPVCDRNQEPFPTYADVPYGTSLRQHKKLFEQEVENLRRQHLDSSQILNETTDNEKETKKTKESRKKRSTKLSGKEIGSRLSEAMTEMEELKVELEACRRRLDAKYQAVAILKEQAECADAELKNTERRANETSRRLEQEVNKLQFELEWKESSFIDSQQTWAERFDSKPYTEPGYLCNQMLGDGHTALVEACHNGAGTPRAPGTPSILSTPSTPACGRISQHILEWQLHRVCQENTILMSKLESRNEELKKANAHKAAISRERDELLALVDVAERLKYEQGKSKVAEDEYGTFSSSELAVLGACKCRQSNPEPCGCAHAAANLRKEVAKLREEGDWLQQRWEECSLTVDAYRSAFEEQLGKSRKLSQRLSQIATLSSRSAKAKAAIKWLIQVMNDDDMDVPSKPSETRRPEEKGNSLADMSLQELVTVLTDMISEKNEALAHQKLAAQVLADKLERLQGKTDTATGSTTREVGVQSPSLPRPPRPAPADMYYYDEVFDLIPGQREKTERSSTSEHNEDSVVVEKEKVTSNLVHDLCDKEVSNKPDVDRSHSFSLSEEEDSVTPFVSADDGEEDEMIKQIIDSQARSSST